MAGLFPTPALWKVGWRYLLRKPWQTGLMILGIALGVAVVVSIDMANQSARRAFELSAETVAGRATHQISAGSRGLPDSLYIKVKENPLVSAAAPVIEEYVSSLELGNQPLQLLGVDPFAEAPFRSYLGTGHTPDLTQLTHFLTQPGAVLISASNAARYGLSIGSRIYLEVGGYSSPVTIAGLLEPSDTLARRTLDGLILVDVSTAQEITGRLGTIDRIDLILPKGPGNPAGELAATLPQGVSLTAAAAQAGALQQMTSAFQTNLTALSLLALLVGLFLIYNSMTFAVVQRRGLFGTLRCLGVTRREVFAIVLSEALVVGVIGSAFGLGLGIALGQITVSMVTQTVNDLYFTTTVRDVGLPFASLVKGVLLGILATVATAIPPSWEASTVSPRVAMSRSGLEIKSLRAVRTAAVGGLIFIALGLGIFALPTTTLTAGFSGTFAVTVGFAMLAAITMVIIVRAAVPITGSIFGLLGRMGPRNLLNSLSRTSIAVAALMVAVAVTVAVSLMIASFRYTVQVWLAQTLQGEVYISAPGFTTTTATTVIDPQVIQVIQQTQGVRRIDGIRVSTVDSPRGPIEVAATSNPDSGSERFYMFRDQGPSETWQAMQQGAVIVSEPLYNRLRLPRKGASLVLNTAQGEHLFPVVGVFYDYSTSQGEIVMSLDVYRKYWNDQNLTAIDLRLQPGASTDGVTRAVQDALGRIPGIQQLIVRPNAVLRSDVMAVFDRTFAITGALNILATIVAFIGVLSSLLLLQLEKQREVGILRAIGLTVRQLWGLVMIESGMMGLVAGLLALPTGYVLSLILIYIINRRSFGWTLQMAVQPEPFLQGLAVALIAALLAGIYPAYKLGKMVAAEAIRYE